MLGIIQDASGMLKAPNGSLLTTLKNGGNAEHGLGHGRVPARVLPCQFLAPLDTARDTGVSVAVFSILRAKNMHFSSATLALNGHKHTNQSDTQLQHL